MAFLKLALAIVNLGSKMQLVISYRVDLLVLR